MSHLDKKTIIKLGAEKPKDVRFGRLGLLDGFVYAGATYIKITDGKAVRLHDVKEVGFDTEIGIHPKQLVIEVQ